MSPLSRFGYGSIAAASIGTVVIACASEGASDPPEAPRDDAAPHDSATEAADGGVDADAKLETPTCTDAGMCRVAAPIDTRINITSIRGSGSHDVWAVGSNRTVLHFDGTAWEKTSIEDDASSPYTMRAVWLQRADDVWILDGPNLRHTSEWRGAATTWNTVASEAPYVPSAIDGRDGTTFIGRLTGTEYGPTSLVKCSGWDEGGLVSPEYLGDTTTANGGIEALTMPLPNEAWGTLGPSGGVGRVVRIYRPDGDPDAAPPSWTIDTYDSRSERSLYGAWGNADAIWLVGESGLVRRIGRSAIAKKVFEIVPSPVTADLRAIFGFATDDVWAVGDESTVVHWDGTRWTKVSTPFDSQALKPRLLSVWGSAKDDVWIGGNAVMLHITGSGR